MFQKDLDRRMGDFDYRMKLIEKSRALVKDSEEREKQREKSKP